MRPGHIRVFDGLRITTEHVNHLQGAMHTALREIREILGLGRVYYGFDVVAEDDGTITIEPGLAFDSQNNRIACDEPRTLEVSFEGDEISKYVCIKYDQVEDGQVEGQFTIIWDSCSVLLREEMPEPEENLIPIARIIKATEEGGSLEIINLLDSQPDEEPAEETEEGESHSAEQPAGEIEPASVDAETPESEEGNGALSGELEEATTAPVSLEEGEEASLIESENFPSGPSPWRLRIEQGVVRPAAEARADNIAAMIVGPMKEKLSGGNDSGNVELLFALAEKEAASAFPVASLSCQTIINATLATVEDDSKEEALFKCQSIARGEATFVRDKVSQFGVSTIQAYSNVENGGAPLPFSELTERGIAHLPIGSLWKGTGEDAAAGSLFQSLQLLIRADKTNANGFKVVCNLLWKGAITEEIIRSIETRKTDFTWEILVAFKALGESQD